MACRSPISSWTAGAGRWRPASSAGAGTGSVSPSVAHDARRPVVIDPVIAFSSYLGGGVIDRTAAVAVDPSGALYVLGHSNSPDFPAAGGLQATNAGDYDVVVSKISADGSTLLFSTYLGGTAAEEAGGIALDGQGNIVVTGSTYSFDFPVRNAIRPKNADDGNPVCASSCSRRDAFVAKLNPLGSDLVFSTYYGTSTLARPRLRIRLGQGCHSRRRR